MPKRDFGAPLEKRLERSLQRAAAVLARSETKSLQKQFEASLPSVGLTPAQRRIIVSMTAGSVSRAILDGIPHRQVIEQIAESARHLALHCIPREVLGSAWNAYDKLTASTLRGLSAAEGTEVAWARNYWRATIAEIVDRAHANGAIEKTSLTDRLRQLEATACDSEELLSGVAGLIVDVFGAEEARVYHVENARAKQRAPQHLSPPRGRIILEAEWASRWKSLWNIPLTDERVAQVVFSAERAMYSRDLEWLQAIRAFCSAAAKRLVRFDEMRSASLRLLELEELERKRISSALHDDPAQSLAVVRLHLEMIEPAIADEDARNQLVAARTVLEQTILQVRRIISDLSPPVLRQLGLAAALRQLVTRFRQSYARHVGFTIDDLPAVNPQCGLVLYRALQECFANISEHSFATHINVSVTATDRVLRLRVEDDGIGFHVEEGLNRPGCFGLAGTRERVRLLGGSLSVQSTTAKVRKGALRQRTGTEISIVVPFSEEDPS